MHRPYNGCYKQFDVIMYHNPCSDGIASAWVINSWQIKTYNTSAELIPCHYGMVIPYIINKNIAIVDFTFSKDDMNELDDNNDIIIIDHHQTAYERLADIHNDKKYISMKCCAAQLLWDIYYGGDTPHFIKIINDNDMWERKFVNEYKALSTRGITYDELDKLYKDDVYANDIYSKLEHEGDVIRKYEDNIISYSIKNVISGNIDNYNIGIVFNVSSVLINEVAHKIAETYDIGAVATINFIRSTYNISIRTNNKDIELHKIASEYNGGGHNGAAGFSIPMRRFNRTFNIV